MPVGMNNMKFSGMLWVGGGEGQKGAMAQDESTVCAKNQGLYPDTTLWYF